MVVVEKGSVSITLALGTLFPPIPLPSLPGEGGVQTGQVNLEKAPGEDILGGTVDKNPPLNARAVV